MVRHDLHGFDAEMILPCNALKEIPAVLFCLSGKDSFPVLGTPHDMIPEGIDISPTICQFCFPLKNLFFHHVYMVPYAVHFVNEKQNICLCFDALILAAGDGTIYRDEYRSEGEESVATISFPRLPINHMIPRADTHIS